jgi:hypothetical protein
MLVVIHHPLASAMGAFLSHRLALAFALGTMHLGLHLDEPHVHHLHHHALTFALWARLSLSIFGPCSSALGAVDVSIDVKRPLGSFVEFLQSDKDVCSGIGSFLNLPLAPAIIRFKALTVRISRAHLLPPGRK